VENYCVQLNTWKHSIATCRHRTYIAHGRNWTYSTLHKVQTIVMVWNVSRNVGHQDTLELDELNQVLNVWQSIWHIVRKPRAATSLPETFTIRTHVELSEHANTVGLASQYAQQSIMPLKRHSSPHYSTENSLFWDTSLFPEDSLITYETRCTINNISHRVTLVFFLACYYGSRYV